MKYLLGKIYQINFWRNESKRVTGHSKFEIVKFANQFNST